MKKQKRVIGILIMAFLCLMMQMPVNAASKISKSKVTLIKGQTIQLKVTGTKSKAKWSSNKKSVATVSAKGKVTAKKKGLATITAKVGSKKYICKVTVKQPVTKIKLNKKSVSLNAGTTVTIKATVCPSTANNKAIKWSSSDTGVATVSPKGVVTALKSGTATITATAKDGSGVKATCMINVKKVYVYLTSLRAYRSEGSIGSVNNRTRTDIFGKTYKNYLWSNGCDHKASSKASFTYRLDRKYNTLEGTFFVPTTYVNEAHYVSIEGDGRTLYSGIVRGGSDSLNFKINIAGVKDLTIIMYGNLNWETILGEPLLSY